MKQERDKFAKARRESRRRKAVGKRQPSSAPLDPVADCGMGGGGDGDGDHRWIKSALGMRNYWQRRKERRMTKRRMRKNDEEGDDMDKDVSAVCNPT